MSFSSVYPYVIIAVCFILLLFLVRLYQNRERYPYAAKHLLTHREYKFYMILRKVADEHNCLICPKVGLKDILSVTDRQNYMKYFCKISQKHVDFVICDQKLNVLFALELDDSTHFTPDAQRRDHFKNKAFAAAGIPLKRIMEIDEANIRELFYDI